MIHLLWEGREVALPNRIEILPEWDSGPLPVHVLHWFGFTIENSEVFRLSSMAYYCIVNLFNFSRISVARIVVPSPAYGSRLT